MAWVNVRCTVCKRSFYRSLRRFNEAKKFKWKTYCSSECLTKDRSKQPLLKCANPLCNRVFRRRHDKRCIANYCSRSCAVKVNNTKYPKKQAVIKNCLICGKEFKSLEKYCSVKCRNISLTISKEIITERIKTFYKYHGRIPLKIEFPHAVAARKRFGSWNKAIITAGFDPNPVLFAKKHIAKDGHKCDSFAEYILDNWLYENNIPHEVHVRYPSSSMSADFLVGDRRIEFIGLEGVSKRYDQLLKKKRALIRDKKITVKEIYPKDIFPKNNLGYLLKEFKANSLL